MNRKISIFSVIILIALSFQYCAQPGTLTGGEKDKDAPVLKKSMPVANSLNFKGNKIVIAFDEYLNFDNIDGKFLSSPPLLEKPKISMKRKSLIVKFDEKLKDSATYVFNFENSVRDYHENNPIKNFKFVFATGNTIDTLEASGTLFDAFTQKPVQDAYVMLYRTYADSIPYKEAPYYIARTDSAGRFTVDYLKEGKYKMFALTDIDMNYKYSLPNEQIAFLDTLISPRAEIILKTDTIKAGTHLHKIIDKDTTELGIVAKDSVVISKKSRFFPSDIKLFLFTEDSKKQYVESFSRDLPGKLTVLYSKFPDTIISRGLNFDLAQARVEKTDTGRAVTFWLDDKKLIERDSLSCIFGFYNLDSLENSVIEYDTVHFTYQAGEDSIAKQFLAIEQMPKEHVHINPFGFKANAPISEIDTSHFKLFQLIDTLVTDPKKQEILAALRPSADRLMFSFARPLVDDLKISFLDSLTLSTPGTITHSPDRKTVICKINNEDLAQKSSLKLKLNYDNDFFLNQIENLTDTVKLATGTQFVIQTERYNPDTIRIQLANPPVNPVAAEIDDANSSDFKIISTHFEREVKIALLNTALIGKDTLHIKLSTNQGDSLEVENRPFNYAIKAIYTPLPQGINKSRRINNDKFYINFKSPYYTDLKLLSIEKNVPTDWYETIDTGKKDSLSFSIKDKRMSNSKDLKIIIEYQYKNENLIITQVSDTLALVSETKNTRKTGGGAANTSKVKVQVKIPVNYELAPAKDSLRNLELSHKWVPGTSYTMQADSFAFTDIFNRHNKRQEHTFLVRKENAYGQLQIAISGTKLFESEMFFAESDADFDSTAFSKLSSGQVLFQLMNSKNEIVHEFQFSQDTITNFEYMLPGEYILKLIYDKNGNGKWDTGNYLKGLQPERVLYFVAPIEVKSDFVNQVTKRVLFFQENENQESNKSNPPNQLK